ncbi:neutral zinc metallopeptidase [Actinomadura formosensis]|uniref:neutral zinc metallopeptidase n=1 Tax=Actinomadura formosensis TaxID=60706 RepID=UPI003D8EC42A
MRETARNHRRRTGVAVVGALVLTGALTGACRSEPRPAAGGDTHPAAQSTRAGNGSPAPPPTGMFDEAGFQEDMRAAETTIDDFWRRHWDRLFTGSYRSPRVAGLYDGRDPRSAPPCGDERLKRDNAAYCPPGDYVAWDAHLMRSGYARGDAWVYLVIAHEWGHAVQARLRRGLVSPAAELQADCLAGAALYGSSADGTLEFEDGDERELVDAFQFIGDRAPWTKPGDHGSAAQRLRNFSRGGENGVRACFT